VEVVHYAAGDMVVSLVESAVRAAGVRSKNSVRGRQQRVWKSLGSRNSASVSTILEKLIGSVRKTGADHWPNGTI